jgi:hypothetical protein
VVVEYKVYNSANTLMFSGSKVGQAMTDDSQVVFEIQDLALPCDTATKGKGTFSISMNTITPASSLYIDPAYFSRQQIQFFWPSNTVAESPDIYTAKADAYGNKAGVSVLGKYSDGSIFVGRDPQYETQYMPFRFIPGR